MPDDLGIKYVINSHSERRQYFGETDTTVNRKVYTAFKNGIIPISSGANNFKTTNRAKNVQLPHRYYIGLYKSVLTNNTIQ